MTPKKAPIRLTSRQIFRPLAVVLFSLLALPLCAQTAVAPTATLPGHVLQALPRATRILGSAHPDTLDDMASLAEVRLEEKKYADAEPLLREALAGYEKTAPGSWPQYRSQSLLGASLAAQTKFAEAESLLVEGYRGMIQKTEAIPFEYRSGIGQAGLRIVQFYEGWGKPDKASAWREKLP
jgi:hypothetical protein